MKGRFRHLIWFIALFAALAVVIWVTYVYRARFEAAYTDEPPSVDVVLSDVLENRGDALEEDPLLAFGTEKEVNVLLLGLDGRKGSKSPHCDAIHMMTLNLETWSVRITSVPRGTYAYIPPGTYPTTEYYLANACSYVDLDYGIAQIEKVVGVKADYYVTVGFSQVLGIMRMFELPTTSTLQWLRHRQSYAIGDPQRSHNQAVFIKDMMLREAGRFREESAKPLFFLLYGLTDTNMDFQTARALAEGFLAAKIDERPNDIQLFMKPYHNTADYHLDLENPDEQLKPLLDRIRPYLSKEDLSDRSLSEVQEELVAYLDEVMEVGTEEDIDHVFTQRLWLQVEDGETRERLHYKLVEDRVYDFIELGDKTSAQDLLTAYIIEKDTLGEAAYAERARGLMRFVLQ